MEDIRVFFWYGLWTKLAWFGMQKQRILELHGIFSQQIPVGSDCLLMLEDPSYKELFKQELALKLIQIDLQMAGVGVDILSDEQSHADQTPPLYNSSTFFETAPSIHFNDSYENDDLVQQVDKCLKSVSQQNTSTDVSDLLEELRSVHESIAPDKAGTQPDSGLGTSIDTPTAEVAAAAASLETMGGPEILLGL